MLRLLPVGQRPAINPIAAEAVVTALLTILDERDNIKVAIEQLQALRAECVDMLPRANQAIAEANKLLAEIERREAAVAEREADVSERERALDDIATVASKYVPKRSK